MSSSHALDGQPTDWLRDNENLFVRFGLNVDDPDARHRNEGAQVRMLTDARLQIAPDRLFPNVVAVTRGAALSIQIRSRAPLGFGFRIATGADPVVDRLYAVDRPDERGYRTATVRRFQHDDQLITIDLMRARLSDTHDRDALQRLWSCEISTWAVRQFLDPIAGRVYDLNHPRFPPGRPAAAQAAARMESMPANTLGLSDTPMVGAVAAGVASVAAAGVGSAAGGEQIDVNAGVIWADGSAEQQFERIQVQAEADPERERIGLLRVHFFVTDAD